MKREIIYFLYIVLSIALLFSCKNSGQGEDNGVIASIDSFAYPEPINAPFPFPEIIIPDIPNKIYNIVDYGAESGGTKDCSQAIREAIHEASNQGGGIVVIPEGEWLTGPIHLESNINLFLDEGAKVLFSQVFTDYLPAVLWRHEGIEVYSYSPFIYANEKSNIAITGKGIFEGRGKAWWDYRRTDNQTFYYGAVKVLQQMGEDGVPVEERVFDSLGYKFLPPPFVVPFRCKNVWIEGVTFRYGAFWTIVPTYCENVVIRNLSVETNGEYGDTPNGDGINPSSSKNILIENCILDTGDDCIAIKSGKNRDGRRVNIPTENIVVRNVTGFRGHGGVVIGSEMSGGVKNLFAYDCNFNGTDRMIRLKAERGRGGYVKNAWYENMRADTIEREAIRLNLLYHGDRLPEKPVDETTPVFENINIKNITCTFSKRNAIQIVGIPEMPIKDVFIDSVIITANKGIEITDGKNIHISHANINATSTDLAIIEHSTNIKLEGITTDKVPDEHHPFVLNNSKDITLIDFNISVIPEFLVKIKEEGIQNLRLDKNSFSRSQVIIPGDMDPEFVQFD